eukprot:3716654-Amphidinium_carterae.1
MIQGLKLLTASARMAVAQALPQCASTGLSAISFTHNHAICHRQCEHMRTLLVQHGSMMHV